ncbi:DoxX-like family protein [Pseudosulfitobacter pseudonitzschiae]|uniref:DoxX-like family protein n=1 Tax=Pseudosulfitobacter pseudonitzschiae TaxID=1402135 RepID=UPI001AF58550|nr:DoxX-like family protein [Pseudosulfitobacter pseudonitzschiae]MBM1815196.1 NAD(P)H-binding protein [Pseudosulfitobacter pseudonitzschiae]MBM1832187.1 NAD(P)H-binding protein [Pseudosulfitobacter pseudonitzschiae]MBM1837055.1 NAD(P)H-binding protein [Pseudosulfitobacter pseudonitzschiae]MBM1841901.1 NAD(P)H-binding protein [Pseudosulfitobacter pseudonitzschiae]MBM1846769.1 NAD(P)H-binding protein [Pseudosulfitobacter pseudonitzschiae]
MRRHVLILGADGFIGRHIAFAARRAGWQVTAHARNPAGLQHMGFDTLRADLTDPATHDPAFWRPVLAEGAHVINAAGLLTGSEATMHAVHVAAPAAVYAALSPGARGVLISAIGIEAQTPFARHRRDGEAAAPDSIAILRPGLVLGHTSYGGSSLARALAALPLVTPVVGKGDQPFNPIHADDLAAIALHCLEHPPLAGLHVVGGPETVTQKQMLQVLRGWMGLRPAITLRLPGPLARMMGTIGDAMRLGPISRTAVDQLSQGVHAPHALPEGPQPRPFTDILHAQPCGAQDLWHARLYLMRPVLRLVLAVLWLLSGLIGLTLPAADFLPLVPDTLPDTALILMARAGGLADLAIAAALLRGWRPRMMAAVQFGMIVAYTAAFTLLNPELWLLPLGGLLKNVPLLVLIAMAAIVERER